MTTAGVNSASIFADARRMHESAMERMAAGDIRDAAEKAWCATKRAADGLILAQTGRLPPKSPDTTRGLLRLARENPEFNSLQDRYFTRQGFLHGECFYTGFCDPIEDIERLIRETANYIQDAERLAERRDDED